MSRGSAIGSKPAQNAPAIVVVIAVTRKRRTFRTGGRRRLTEISKGGLSGEGCGVAMSGSLDDDGRPDTSAKTVGRRAVAKRELEQAPAVDDGDELAGRDRAV